MVRVDLFKLMPVLRPVPVQAVYKLEAGDRGGPLHDFFRSSEIAELPPRLRAIFEENKVSHCSTQKACERPGHEPEHAARTECGASCPAGVPHTRRS